jgi:superoxide reductase
MNIFYCKHCKRIVYTYPDGGTLTCCGEEMTLLQPKSKDVGNEKHLPVVEYEALDQIKVTVGSVIHPMAPEHFIQWIFIAQKTTFQIKTFEPGNEPTATFFINPDEDIKIYEFCNLHGLWLTEIKN